MIQVALRSEDFPGEARVEAVEGFPGGMERPQKSSFVFLMMFLSLSQKEHVDDVFLKKNC